MSYKVPLYEQVGTYLDSVEGKHPKQMTSVELLMGLSYLRSMYKRQLELQRKEWYKED